MVSLRVGLVLELHIPSHDYSNQPTSSDLHRSNDTSVQHSFPFFSWTKRNLVSHSIAHFSVLHRFMFAPGESAPTAWIPASAISQSIKLSLRV
ncbi:hypothetical protein CGLO_17528 [Colletotrichum gloeosporioides Cg-14]|uniref:Uncharacterized protein n=1 Tax=Colletotrichum gloeosporioides (strain Cg-14) TaxID=1237896 RepID=T0JWK9_COLGC|nr:hypothetical protein CGLO_17528 [Colletotrichum gloeosporioides Cg-14]